MTLFNPNDQTTAFITLLITVLLPVLVGLVTKVSTSSGTKAVLLAFLSAVTGVGSALIEAGTDDIEFDLYPMFLSAVSVFVIAVATHYGLWKPTLVSAKAQNTLRTDNNNTSGTTTTA